MVYRVYVEKKKGLQNDANSLKQDLSNLLQIKGLDSVRIINRYDVENIHKDMFQKAISGIFAEPQLDNTYFDIDFDADYVLAVEYLPGQFDQRADSACQCIQIMSQMDRPIVKTAKIYMFYGNVLKQDIEKIKEHIINPVEARQASLDKVETLQTEYDIPTTVKTLYGFNALDEAGLAAFIKEYGLAMDDSDIVFCQAYFRSENREPTITEIKMIDTYWSDHCRHTTFLTTIDSIECESPLFEEALAEYKMARKELNREHKPITLMDLATIGAKILKKEGKLENIDESEEINACTVKIKVEIEGEMQDWLLLFKNETHNHPTEIEPFGGAATCMGGAIRDPLSGRAYVYSAMRVTGAGNPLTPVEDTIKGKLPQRKIVTTASNGYSSYGNQIGLATGIVDEIYHEGYTAKRMEIGAVIGAVPSENVRRECPSDGDVVILLGGATGRDGCGGATGSSKAHSVDSLALCGAEVQKGNAPEERKLQRLFRRKQASLLIKRCNDFGAGGVSVAIGELSDGIMIDLNKVPKKYEGLDGTELAISESQERMAVVVEAKDADEFIKYAHEENLNAAIVAVVTENPRLVMNWNGNVICDISREFLNSNGAEKHTDILLKKPSKIEKDIPSNFSDGFIDLVGDLNICSKRGLSERFDSTIGAGTVLMPFGGKNQQTPIQAMVNKISVQDKHTKTCSLMSWGYNPFLSSQSPYHGAYLAVVESVSKLIATGASIDESYLTFQEYFEKPKNQPARWGKPFSAVLGAFKAQLDLGIASIGGKDSMSGTFENIDVPPTLVSFAVTTDSVDNIISPEFKNCDSVVCLISPTYDKNGLPEKDSYLAIVDSVTKSIREGKILSSYTPTYGGISEGIFKMAIGNGYGFEFAENLSLDDLFGYKYGSFILEMKAGEILGDIIGKTTSAKNFVFKNEVVSLDKALKVYENKLEDIYTCNIAQSNGEMRNISYNTSSQKKSTLSFARPKVLIPVFPGTNCEFDTAKALNSNGCDAEIFVIRNSSSNAITDSINQFAKKIENSQMIFIPGGFSGGDEPDGSGKFITSFFKNQKIMDAVHELLKSRDGLMAGICNGFQALIKLGLVTYGEICECDENTPTLTFNTISRHQSRIVQTRIASNMSPWLSGKNVGDIVNVAISHGEGKFIANSEWLAKIEKNGQIATQYVDFDGNATSNILFNPNDSVLAIEGITSPCGRVFGKMGHSERIGYGLYKNVVGDYDIKMFENAQKYYK